MNHVLPLLNARSKELGIRWRQSHDALFWIAASATVVLAVTVGFFLHGGLHGLYMDDYSEKAWAFDFVAAKWKLNLIPQFHIRPLAHVLIANLANAIPNYEFPVRVFIVAIHLLNVLLVGKLAYRLTGSRFVAAISGAFFLFPIFANEALLWFSPSIANTISLSLLLIGFHCLLSCRSPGQDLRLFCCGVGAWILMVLFYESGLFTLLLLPVILGTARRDNLWQHAKVWVPALSASYIPMGAYLALVERTDPGVTSRGGPTLNLAFILSRRIPEVSENFWWLVTDRGRLPGHRFALISGPLREALGLGWHEWLSVPWGTILIGISIAGVCLIALLFPVDRGTAPDFFSLLGMAVIGCAWAVLSLIPLVLVKSQIVEIRTLYAPSAGFAMGAAALVGLAVHFLPRWRRLAIRLSVLISGVIMFLTSLTMAGAVRTYQLRSYHDQKELGGLQPIISKIQGTQMLWLLPIGLDEQSFGVDDRGRNAALDAYVFGVFETPWSARDAVRLGLREQGFEAVTANRWVNPQVTSVRYSESGRPTDIVVQGRTVPIRQLLAFTYQQSRVILLSPLDLDPADGGSEAVIDLPLVGQLAEAGIEAQPYHLQLERGN